MRNVVDWRRLGQAIGIVLGIGTFLSIINPYGATARLPLWMGWLYWVGMIGFGTLVGVATMRLSLRWLEGRSGLIIWAVISSVTSLTVTPVLSCVHYLLGDHSAFEDMPMLYALVWVISAAMSALGWLIYILRQKNEVGTKEDASTKHEETIRAFMSRLPLPYRNAELWALSSEDHYLRAHTSAGEHLFLERLASAIHQLDGAVGLQTHRSWWVAETGVKSAISQNGRIILTLHSGVEAPVSRTFASAVRDAGWV